MVELALGLSLIWLVLAGLSSSFLEGVRLVFHRRQKTLFAAIGTLLDGTNRPGGASLTAKLYRAPEVRHEIPWRRRRRLDMQPPLRRYWPRSPDPVRRLATYGPERLEPETFAAAVQRSGLEGELSAGVLRQAGSPGASREGAKPTSIVSGGTVVDTDGLANWFRRGMSVVSIEYRRTSRIWLFAIGLVVAVAIQIDTIAVADHLWTDATARSALAESRIECPPGEATTCTVSIGPADLPIGWGCDSAEESPCEGFWSFVRSRVFGWLLTALAVSLGAPFWYQVVRRLTPSRGR